MCGAGCALLVSNMKSVGSRAARGGLKEKRGFWRRRIGCRKTTRKNPVASRQIMTMAERSDQPGLYQRGGEMPRVQAHQRADAALSIVFGAAIAAPEPGIIGHGCLCGHSRGRHDEHSRRQRNPSPEKQYKHAVCRQCRHGQNYTQGGRHEDIKFMSQHRRHDSCRFPTPVRRGKLFHFLRREIFPRAHIGVAWPARRGGPGAASKKARTTSPSA